MTAGDEAKESKFTPGPNAVDITENKDGGVFKEIIKEGEGDALPGIESKVVTNYKGTLTDGTVFDSNDSFEFTLGKGSVIKAWDIGVATMKKGEVARFTCSPEYAYGKRGSPPKIPPDSTLIFEITLVSWKIENISKSNDDGILRTIIRKGKDYATPIEGGMVEVHLTGKYNGKVFEDRDLSFNLGEGCKFGVIKGIEIALSQFKKDEKSSLEIKPKYAFKEEGHKEFGIPPNATVTYIVELKNFEKIITWDMDAEGSLAQAKVFKEKATNYFKEGKYPMALKLYKHQIKCINTQFESQTEENAEREALLLAGRLNLGLTYLKMNQEYKALEECEKALKLDPNNVKALFRKGQAYLKISEPEKAKIEFESVLKLEPANKVAASQITACLNQMKMHKEREKKIYANMFEKFAQKDKEKSKLEPEPVNVKELGEWEKEENMREPTELEQENLNMLNVEMIN